MPAAAASGEGGGEGVAASVWFACNRLRRNTAAPDSSKAQPAGGAGLEELGLRQSTASVVVVCESSSTQWRQESPTDSAYYTPSRLSRPTDFYKGGSRGGGLGEGGLGREEKVVDAAC